MEASHPPRGLGASSLLADAKSRGKRCYELQVRECRDSLTEAIGDGKLKRCRAIARGHRPLPDIPFHSENCQKRK